MNSTVFLFCPKYDKIIKVMENIQEKVKDLEAKLLHLEDRL